jgi:3-deoxy-7-phosphoheptulonate synthase
MIIILKKDAGQKQIDSLVEWLKARKITPHISAGEHETLIGCVGDVAKMELELVQVLERLHPL